MTRRVPYWWKWGCFMTFLGNFSIRCEKYYFCVVGSMWDEIESTWGEIEHWNKHWNEHLSWRLGSGDKSEGQGRGPLSGIPSPLSGIPSPLSGIPFPFGIPPPLSSIPSPTWYPTPLTSHQSGILYSLIFLLCIAIRIQL